MTLIDVCVLNFLKLQCQETIGYNCFIFLGTNDGLKRE